MPTKLASIKQEIKHLHDISPEEYIRVWFYEGHVALVAKYAEEIAIKVGADAEIASLASLFHDIARAWSVDDEPALMNESLAKAEELMKKYSYSPAQIEQVKSVILTHSCRESMPTSEEGKVMATADALAHLMSDFYFILPFYGWLRAADTFDGYKEWLLKKIDRDFNKKIFYEEYRKLAQPKYEALKTVFK